MRRKEGDRLTPFQRAAYARMLKLAAKRRGEPLTPEDWRAYYELGVHRSSRAVLGILRALPRSPRCRACGAPFAGLGGRLVGPLGYRPSRKNPAFCATCVELAPPGGMTMEIGVLFADARNYTGLAELLDPQELSVLLRRFYGAAEAVLFDQALIDKLIGDEVMALYIPLFARTDDDPAERMLEDALELLRRVGHGTAEGAFLEVGVGLDFGEAFVGNIGDRALYDFTAVGDVVNTASRLTGNAKGGEVLVSDRLARRLPALIGDRVELRLKGKAEPVTAWRVAVDRADGRLTAPKRRG